MMKIMYIKIKFLMPEKSYNYILHKGAKPSTYITAQNLRQVETEAENWREKNSGDNIPLINLYWIFIAMNVNLR